MKLEGEWREEPGSARGHRHLRDSALEGFGDGCSVSAQGPAGWDGILAYQHAEAKC